MLPLESPRWRDLATFRPWDARLPVLLDAWRAAAGSDAAEAIWHELRDFVVQQFSISEAAYAVVPHLVAALERVKPQRRLDYLIDLGDIEAARTSPGAPAVPEDLSDPYREAISRATQLAFGCLSLDLPRPKFRSLVGVVCSLHGHPGLARLLENLDGLYGECPEEIAASGYWC